MIPERNVCCCFTGHRPDKLKIGETELRLRLEDQIDQAIADGFTAFISGMAPGTDLVAAEIVLEKKKSLPEIKLIAAVPFPGVSKKWTEDWQKRFAKVLENADESVEIYTKYTRWVFHKRDGWMVDHAQRVIACYNSTPGGTAFTVRYAENHDRDIRVIKEC